jgi:hypothetical protein
LAPYTGRCSSFGGILMSRNFVVRAAFATVAVMCALVVLESQANACFGLFNRHRGCRSSSCCSSSCESSCGCAAEPSCGCSETVMQEPSCGCAAPEPSCGCEASCGCESSCGCQSSCDSGCGRHSRLFGRRNRGCGSSCGCQSSCGCASMEPSCGCTTVEPSTPASDAPSMEAPPAPENSDAA